VTINHTVRESSLLGSPRFELANVMNRSTFQHRADSTLGFWNPGLRAVVSSSDTEGSAAPPPTSPWTPSRLMLGAIVAALVIQIGFKALLSQTSVLQVAWVARLVESGFDTVLATLLSLAVVWPLVIRPLKRALEVERVKVNQILERSAEAIVSLDSAGRIVSINPSAARMFGYSASEVVGESFLKLFTFSGQAAQDIKSSLKAATFQQVPRGLKKDQTTFPIELSITEVMVEGRRLVTLFVRDLTEVQNWKRKQEEAVNQLRSVLDAATRFSIVATDAHGVIEVFNTGAERMLGYQASEVIGRMRLDQLHLPQELREEAQRLETRLGQPIDPIEVLFEPVRRLGFQERTWTYVRKDGSTLLVNLVTTPRRDSAGRIVGYVGIADDVTEQVRYQEEIRRARDRADAANRAKSEFLASMSHEIRTPMTSILGHADILNLPDLTPQRLAEARGAIQAAGRHLLRIINDILDLAKIEAGKLPMEILPCDPWTLAREVVAGLRINATRRELALTLEAAGPLPKQIQTDPNRLRQVLYNLVGNAIKFTEKGGVRLIVSFDPSACRLSFDVIDTGVGMTPEQVGKLFTPFYQAERTHNAGGTGLGLVISKRLAERLGGTIKVQSQRGRGSVFSVLIPVDPAAARELVPKAELERIAREPIDAANESTLALFTTKLIGRVLLAEDTPEIRQVILFHLRRLGLTVEVVENGELAVEKALAGPPFDLILMDLQMPITDGYEATARLRASGFEGPIVALTAHTMTGERERCLRAGFTDHLGKPIDLNEFLTLMNRYLKPAPRLVDQSDSPTQLEHPTAKALAAPNQDAPASAAAPVAAANGAVLAASRPEAADGRATSSSPPPSDDATAKMSATAVERGPNHSDSGMIPLLTVELKPGESRDDIGLVHLLARYIQGLPAQATRLRDFWSQGDWQKVEQLAHRVLGSSGMYGLSDLNRIAARIEQAARRHDDIVADELDALDREIERLGQLGPPVKRGSSVSE